MVPPTQHSSRSSSSSSGRKRDLEQRPKSEEGENDGVTIAGSIPLNRNKRRSSRLSSTLVDELKEASSSVIAIEEGVEEAAAAGGKTEKEDVNAPTPSSSTSKGQRSLEKNLSSIVPQPSTSSGGQSQSSYNLAEKSSSSKTKTTTREGGAGNMLLSSPHSSLPTSPSPLHHRLPDRSRPFSSKDTPISSVVEEVSESDRERQPVDSGHPSSIEASARNIEEGAVGDQSFYTADLSSGEADTSGSAMAEHGHGVGSSHQQRGKGAATATSSASSADSTQRRYLLHVIQQPTTGCAFGSSLLSRLALAPPLIVHMQAIDRAGREISIEEDLPFLVCHVHLTTDDGTSADMLSPTNSPRRISREDQPSRTTKRSSPPSSRKAPTQLTSPSQSVRMLYGTLVASPMQLHTTNDRPATMFIFPEISIRSRGKFRLQISLMRVPLPSSSPKATTTLATASTDAFNVVLSSDYIAPHITDLTRHFARQGVGLLLPPSHTGE